MERILRALIVQRRAVQDFERRRVIGFRQKRIFDAENVRVQFRVASSVTLRWDKRPRISAPDKIPSRLGAPGQRPLLKHIA